MFYPIRWPGFLRLGSPPDPQRPSPPPIGDIHARVEALRAEFAETITELRVELAGERAAREAEHEASTRELDKALAAQADQRHMIATLQSEIDGRKTVEQQLRGELRESNTRIQALEQQLIEERTARTAQAAEVGYLKANLDASDQRLAKQRTLIDEQGKKIAVLEDQNTQATGKLAGLQMALDMTKRDLDTVTAERDAYRTRYGPLDAPPS